LRNTLSNVPEQDHTPARASILRLDARTPQRRRCSLDKRPGLLHKGGLYIGAPVVPVSCRIAGPMRGTGPDLQSDQDNPK
jgi:hypothetical protein